MNAIEIGEDSANSKAILKKSEYAIEVNGEQLLWWNVDKHETEEANEPRYVIEIPTNFYDDVFDSEQLKPKSITNIYVSFTGAHPGIIPYAVLVQ